MMGRIERPFPWPSTEGARGESDQGRRNSCLRLQFPWLVTSRRRVQESSREAEALLAGWFPEARVSQSHYPYNTQRSHKKSRRSSSRNGSKPWRESESSITGVEDLPRHSP
jgi:hypothetical protein